jgi:hypothetical protein
MDPRNANCKHLFAAGGGRLAFGGRGGKMAGMELETVEIAGVPMNITVGGTYLSSDSLTVEQYLADGESPDASTSALLNAMHNPSWFMLSIGDAFAHFCRVHGFGVWKDGAREIYLDVMERTPF